MEQRKIIQNATRKNKLKSSGNDVNETIEAQGNLQDVVTPVSYTHLDVYKRQYIYKPLVRFFNLIKGFLSFQGRLILPQEVDNIKTPVTWVGNKTSILPIIYQVIPLEYCRYVEPFG